MSADDDLQTLTLARSLLFVPAGRPDRYVKALNSGADAVIVDLEDAVASDAKERARAQLFDGFLRMSPAQRARVLVRVNAANTPWHVEDRAMASRLVAHGLCAVVLPKTEQATDLHALADVLGNACGFLPQIETLKGLDRVEAIASAPQVVRLVFGNLDFQVDLGMRCDADEAELQPIRLALIMASRRAGLAPPVDGVTLATHDVPRLQSDVSRSRRCGFGGKLCIHPTQVGHVNAGFVPDSQELAWARQVVQGYAASGGAVFQLDGRMIDAPVVHLARRTIALSGDRADCTCARR